MKKYSLLLAAALCAPVAAYAQETTSSIRGEVVADGSPVANAEVVVTHEPSGTQSETSSDGDGSFTAPGLRVGGPYTVAISAEGHEEQRVTGIFLTAGEPLRLPVELRANGQEIIVTASRDVRETSNGPITAMSREEIEGVASVTRDIRDIARRDPFVTMDPSNSRTIEIAGQNGRLNRFSVDGVQFSDDFGLNNGGLPTSRGPVPFDAIEQLAVKVAPFDIEEGDFQGGAINVVLRSGGNRFTGSASYAYLDDSLTGDEIRGQPVSLNFKSEQYGGFLSGPLIKDKLFFALAYSKLEESDPIDEGPADAGFATPIPRVTGQLVDQISAIAQGVYNYDTLGVLTNATEEDEKITAKLDWNITEGQRASLTYIRNTGNQQFTQNMVASPTGPTFGYRSNAYELTEEVNSGVFQLNSDWTDNFSTQFRAAYRDYNRDQTPFGGRDFPQMEICLDPVSVVQASGNTFTTCGNTLTSSPRLFFGPDVSRQSNDLNTENLSLDLTADLTLGAHRLKAIFGYTDIDVFNLFLQRSLGDIYFDSIADFEAGRASRFRLAGTPSGDVNDAAAMFSTQTYTFGLQDDFDISDTLQVSVGARYDYYASGDEPPLNQNFLDRYGFPNQVTYDGLGVFQPRVGFNWRPLDRLIIRGGVGLFAGGTPDVFLSNSFSNTGQLTNAIDIQRNAACDTTALCDAALNDIDPRAYDQIVLDFLRTNTGSFALAPVNAIDPDFDPPSQIRATLSASYDADFGALGDNWLLGADFVYGSTYRGITYVDFRSVPAGTLPDGRPRYAPLNNVATTNQDLVLTNDNRGRSIIAVARLEKEWDFGLGIGASYTFQDIKDVNPITSATAGSLYGNAAMADPNAAEYGTSIYEVKHSVKLSADYKRAFFGDYETRFAVFGEYHSGRPFSYTFRDQASGRSAVFGTLGSNQRYLFYVPTGADDPLVSYDSVATQDALLDFIDSTSGLSEYRGSIVPKNTGRSPGAWKVDLHFDQEIPTFVGRSRIKLFVDVENFLNLLDSDLGVQRQVAFPYFAQLVNVQCLSTPTPTGTAPAAGVVNTSSTQTCAQYRYASFDDPTITVQNQNRQSLYQIRVGVRFEF